MSLANRKWESIRVPEYDEKLDHVFFASKSVTKEDREMERELREEFQHVYKTFFENREAFINEARNLADKSYSHKRNCNISMITGSSVGIAGGAAALVGTFAFPPLLIGGLVVGGIAVASNVGTNITEFCIFQNLMNEMHRLLKYDTELTQSLEEVYQKIVVSNLFELEERNGEDGCTMSVAASTVPALGIQIGSAGAKGAIALGLRSLGIEMASLSSGVLRGIARGAVGISVVIDGATIVYSAVDLAKGSNTKFSDAIIKMADEKEEELHLIKKRVEATGLLGAILRPL